VSLRETDPVAWLATSTLLALLDTHPDIKDAATFLVGGTATCKVEVVIKDRRILLSINATEEKSK